VLLDASVVRNFGVVGKGDILLLLLAEPVLVDVVLSIHGDGEVPRIRLAIERELLSFRIGSGEHSMWIAALAGIDDLMNGLRGCAQFITLDPREESIAHRLTSVTPEDRAWRSSFGVKARRIHAGEAACIAVAVTRGIAFATDDNDAAHAYVGLSQRTPESTLSLLKRSVTLGMLDDQEARAEWDRLNRRLRGRLNHPWA
jgi:hypothetical protein